MRTRAQPRCVSWAGNTDLIHFWCFWFSRQICFSLGSRSTWASFWTIQGVKRVLQTKMPRFQWESGFFFFFFYRSLINMEDLGTKTAGWCCDFPHVSISTSIEVSQNCHGNTQGNVTLQGHMTTSIQVKMARYDWTENVFHSYSNQRGKCCKSFVAPSSSK